MKKPLITVIICTINRLEPITRCLQGLANQSQKQFEVIIIDGRGDNLLTKRLINFQNLLSLKHFVINQHNLPLARNLGISHATAPLIAFIDDDAVPRSHWIESILKIHRSHPNTVLFAGKIKADSSDYLARFSQTFFSHGDYPKPITLAPGVNLVLNYPLFQSLVLATKVDRKQVFNNSMIAAGDDTELCSFIHFQLRGQMIYHPSFEVIHQYRTTWRKFIKRQFQYAWGDTIVSQIYPSVSLIQGYRRMLKLPVELLLPLLIFAYPLRQAFRFSQAYGWYWFPASLVREIAYSAGVYYSQLAGLKAGKKVVALDT